MLIGESPPLPQHNVNRACPAVPRLRGPHRCDLSRMRAMRQPVEEFGADGAAAVGAVVVGVVGAGFAGDEEHDAGAHGEGLRQAGVEAGVGGV